MSSLEEDVSNAAQLTLGDSQPTVQPAAAAAAAEAQTADSPAAEPPQLTLGEPQPSALPTEAAAADAPAADNPTSGPPPRPACYCCGDPCAAHWRRSLQAAAIVATSS